MTLYVGVMSGTSMDAVDAAVVDLGRPAPHLIARSHRTWPRALRERLQQLAAGAAIDAAGIATLDREVGEFLAQTICEMLQAHAIDSGRIRATGCHGQTVSHSPDSRHPSTLQLGDANVIAELTGITTVNDFRRRDIAAGGQGAPLVPAFHAAFLRDEAEDRVVLNLGGIANITVLPADRKLPVTGFDTGPANCLMDGWIQRQQGLAFDKYGEWAASTRPDAALLERLQTDPYFARPPPKSTGTQHFSADWLDQRLATTGHRPAAEVQATLLALTCHTVLDAIRRHAPSTGRLLVCGGGVNNQALMHSLDDLLAVPVQSTAGFGIDPEWMEAMAFAWLAQRTLDGLPGNLPSVTGAVGERILGAVHQA
jgi:anhydro-N-acetylmuramic acid kinase